MSWFADWKAHGDFWLDGLMDADSLAAVNPKPTF